MPKQQASVLRYCSSLQILLFYMYYTDQEAEKAILVGVALQSEGITYEQMTEYLDELSFLAETAGAETVKIFTPVFHMAASADTAESGDPVSQPDTENQYWKTRYSSWAISAFRS